MSLLRTRLVHEKSMKNQLVVYPDFYDKSMIAVNSIFNLALARNHAGHATYTGFKA